MIGESDNVAVVATINRKMTSSTVLARIAGPFLLQLRRRGYRLTMKHIPGKTMVDKRMSDKLSRLMAPYWAWPLRMDQVLTVLRTFSVNGLTVVDLFADEASARFRRFVAFQQPQGALWMDAFSKPWSTRTNSLLPPNGWLWVFPPPHQLARVMTRLSEHAVKQEPINLILVVANTKGAWWLAEIERNQWLVQTPIPLGRWDQIVSPPESRRYSTVRGPPPRGQW